MITYINKNKASPLFIDKFSATLAVPYDDESIIFANIMKLIDVGYAKKVYKPLYFLSAKVFIGNFNVYSMLVQCSPKNENTSFFRIEFNPAKIIWPEARGFIDGILPMHYKGLVNHGICTRIDATVDVKREEIAKLLIFHPGILKTSDYYKSGRTETLYLGSKTSPKLICVYDKIAEIKRSNSHTIIKTEVPKDPITRIEARLRKRVPIKDLAEVPNMFEKLCISSYQSIPYLDEKFELFLMASQASNGQNVLLALSESTRKKYRKYLKNYPAKWWKPDDIWQQWPNVIDLLLNPPIYAYKPSPDEKMTVTIGG